MEKSFKNKLSLAVLAAITGMSGAANAQSDGAADESAEVVVVEGIRAALISALDEKRNAKNLTEVIQAEDIGKLPDQNLAEVLENITGIQIDRTNGVGTGVQIRGTGANRVEINGVSTVTSGAGRTGISFEDLPAALIASVEVTKAPTAKTIEGSVGGTINLRTLRGNSLKEPLAQVRYQREESDLADSTTPRFSATLGNNWDTDVGKVGVVVTANVAQLDVASANPRFDRDRVNLPDSSPSSQEFPFLRTQFLDQPFEIENYETTNFTASVEFEPTDNLSFYLDATVNDQERARKSARAFFSGTGFSQAIDATTDQRFETIDLGSLDGQFGTLDLGQVTVVTSGVIGVGTNSNGVSEPNLRVGSDNSSRLTKSNVFAFGGEWENDSVKVSAEISYSDSETDEVSLNTGMDFINPNHVAPSPTTSADNGTPAIFSIENGPFEFGIAQGLAATPSTQDLLDRENYALSSVNQGLRIREGEEKSFRVDAVYDISESVPFLTDLSAGLRWNSTSNFNRNAATNNRFTQWNRPRASLFPEIVVEGPNNFNDADSRELFISDYLIIDNDLSFENPDLVRAVIDRAIAVNNFNQGEAVNDPLGTRAINATDFFDIEEETSALYIQADYELDLGVPVSGNLGFRYVTTDIDATGATEDSVTETVTEVNESNDHSFVLPRFNLVADLSEGLLLRAGIGKDIRRPDFNDLSPSTTFFPSAVRAVEVGNPQLDPEEIWSYDLSLEYYFSDSGYVSAGIFRKERDNLITLISEPPAEPIGANSQVERDVTAPCEEGGIFNPIVPPSEFGVFSSSNVPGICVARATNINASETETQQGIELAAQYDLAQFEDRLGWASGFGVIVNYTYQEASNSIAEFDGPNADDAINVILGRDDPDNSTPTLDDDLVTKRRTLEDLSKNSYNFTLFYEKYGISARARYTYRSSFIERLNRNRFNIPPVIGARGQLNVSFNYDINENITVGVEGVNLGQEDRTRWCFNENTLLCEQSLTDRRITFGVTARL